MADHGSYFVATLHGNDTTGNKRKRQREKKIEKEREKRK